MSTRNIGLDLFRKNATCHGDELLLLFKSCEIPMHGYFSDTDKKVGKPLLEYWTNFIKNGKPTNIWHKLKTRKCRKTKILRRLQINSEGEVIMENLNENPIIKSWLKIYEDYSPKIKQLPLLSQNGDRFTISESSRYCTN